MNIDTFFSKDYENILESHDKSDSTKRQLHMIYEIYSRLDQLVVTITKMLLIRIRLSDEIERILDEDLKI